MRTLNTRFCGRVRIFFKSRVLSVEKADHYFAISFSFSDGDGEAPDPPQTKKDWIEDVGVYWYYSLILAKFNPTEARNIFDSTAEEIAQAYVSMKCYEYSPKKESHGR